MANEFDYCVSVCIVHPSVDPQLITNTISILRPQIETMAGSEGRGKDGTPLIPIRKAELSVWSADLHDEEKLNSNHHPISDFILNKVEQLRPYRDLFLRLREEGNVALSVGLFSISNYSAAVLDAEMLKTCGDLGIDIEMNFYGPRTE